MISQQNEAVGILERKRAQEDAFDEREDRGGGADAKRQREDDGQGESRRLAQLAQCEAEILCERVHAPSLAPKFTRLYKPIGCGDQPDPGHSLQILDDHSVLRHIQHCPNRFAIRPAANLLKCVDATTDDQISSA